MSISEAVGTLRITAAPPGSRITVVDARLLSVASASDSLEISVPPGVYRLRARVADGEQSRLVIVAPGAVVREHMEVPFRAVAPLGDVGRAAAVGGRSGSFVIQVNGVGPSFEPARHLDLVDHRGNEVDLLRTGWETAHGYATWSADLPAGGYLLRLLEQQWIEQSLWLPGGWQTLLFIDCDEDRHFLASTVHLTPSGTPWRPSESANVLLETMMGASRAGTAVDEGDPSDNLLRANPMVGLAMAHVRLLLSEPEQAVASLVHRLVPLLPNHPDVLAMDQRRSTGWPPMFASSYRLRLGPAAGLELPSAALAGGPWLRWIPFGRIDGDSNVEPDGTGEPLPKGEREFLEGPAASSHAPPTPEPFTLDSLPSGADEFGLLAGASAGAGGDIVFGNKYGGDHVHGDKTIGGRPDRRVRRQVVLLMSANADGQRPLRLDAERREMERALDSAEAGDRLEIRYADAIRLNDLQSALLRHQPAIAHFSGQGMTSGGILLADESGQVRPVPPSVLSDLFRTLHQDLRCVVLNACFIDEQARAIAAHVPWVVGSGRRVTDDAAIQFAAGFYQGIASGESIRSSFELVRNRLALNEHSDIDIPRLIASPGANDRAVIAARRVSVVPTTGATDPEPDPDRNRTIAEYDQLTGILSRYGFRRQAERIMSAASANESSRIWVYMIDIDGFKAINDEKGHQAGDQVLKAVAERLRACLPQEAAPGRIGGDEFVAAWVADAQAGEGLLETIRNAFGDPILFEGGSIAVGVSVGAASDDGAEVNIDNLIRDADAAMYRIKSRKKAGAQVFTSA